MIRVLLAEDQAMMRGALAALLALEEDVKIVAEASHRDEVVPAALEALPDVALLDIEMPGDDDGLSAAADLRERLPSCRAIVVTTFGRAGYLKRAMESGAVGFLLKDAPPEELAAAIRRTMSGERGWIRTWPPQPSARATTRSRTASERCLRPRSTGRL